MESAGASTPTLAEPEGWESTPERCSPDAGGCDPEARDAASSMQEAAKICKSNKVSFVFGKESSGLTNEELDRAQRHVSIPVEEKYPSLNLAAEVLILCY